MRENGVQERKKRKKPVGGWGKALGLGMPEQKDLGVTMFMGHLGHARHITLSVTLYLLTHHAPKPLPQMNLKPGVAGARVTIHPRVPGGAAEGLQGSWSPSGGQVGMESASSQEEGPLVLTRYRERQVRTPRGQEGARPTRNKATAPSLQPPPPLEQEEILTMKVEEDFCWEQEPSLETEASSRRPSASSSSSSDLGRP
ncbi:hypothetical protein HPG69_011877 [Diceros bicornis minor]|uniref:Uncharacterized protein n=1 Tax=Diceros bicornis minor TaxID=77932 RepID=A0A7J7ESL6_DICBM|nr:hypothetical protein HPG69_011877 [Diceros bicornis minor]